MTFASRSEAGRKLAEKLRHFRHTDAVVLALPRGGVPVAAPIADVLGLPLRLLLVKKIGHPVNREHVVGVVSLEDRYLLPHAGVADRYIELETQRVRSRLSVMKEAYGGCALPGDIEGRIVIVVDDGIATADTMTCVLGILSRRRPAMVVVAAPVISASAMARLQRSAQEVVALVCPGQATAISAFYDDFPQLTDEQALGILARTYVAGLLKE